MNYITLLFGQGKDLHISQMCARSVVVFFIALLLIRISGRRSFGLRAPLDNIITILLGAVLSRAVVGASPFLPVIVTCFLIVVLHRLLSWLTSRSASLGKFVEGREILLFEHGHFIGDNLRKALICKADVMQGVRKSASTEDMNQIERVYMECNGEISVIKKPERSDNIKAAKGIII